MGGMLKRIGRILVGRTLGLGLVLFLVSFAFPSAVGPAGSDTRLFSPLKGSLFLAGQGEMHESVLLSFMQVSGGRMSRIVLLSSGSERETSAKRWEKAGAQRVEVLRVESSEQLREDPALQSLLSAEGLWIEKVNSDLWEDPLFVKLVQSVLVRKGALGGSGDAALKLGSAHLGDEGNLSQPGLGLLPASLVHLGSKKSEETRLRKALTMSDGVVGWMISKGTALVIHQGRRVGAMGEGEVLMLLPSKGGWPERIERLDALGNFEYGKRFPSNLDLLALQRSAAERGGPLFPPKKAAVPKVAKGTLIMHGGGGVSDEVFERFIEEAGGKNGRIVCIPSADAFDPGEQPDSYSAEKLRELGCKNVTILHTARNDVADLDEAFLEPLLKAKGIWMDGGRTYRLIDSFQGTRAHELMFDVLKRGGVVAGSSAGAQVIGDFLVRGNPRSNKTLVFEGYTSGLGFLQGVIIDAHFRQRDRGKPFAELMEGYPQMLGIGLDEETALVIQGTQAQVLGENRVSFYDLSGKKNRSNATELESGESYDLKRRAKRK